MLVLDTHAAVWWAGEPRRLSQRARERIAAAQQLMIPAIVFWEVALLVRRRRLDLGMTAAAWAETIQAVPRVAAVALTPAVAVRADALEMHADPADRFIVATALDLRAPLVSKDRLMRGVSFLETVW